MTTEELAEIEARAALQGYRRGIWTAEGAHAFDALQQDVRALIAEVRRLRGESVEVAS